MALSGLSRVSLGTLLGLSRVAQVFDESGAHEQPFDFFFQVKIEGSGWVSG